MSKRLQTACRRPVGMVVAVLALTGLGTAPLRAQDTAADTGQRSVFDAEICKVDGLDAGQCQCVWDFLNGKLSAGDFKLGLLLVASNSDDSATVKKADEQLDKSNASDKRRDQVSSEMSALVIDAEDACP